MHLGVFTAPLGNYNAGWRLPGALARTEDFPSLVNIARIAERARLDFIFFSDAPVCSFDSTPSSVLRLEPVTLLAALAACTSHIGLVATVSTTFTEPYNLARYMASIDQISGGRAGWNVVTTGTDEAAHNFGRAMPAHDLRYEIADEYMQVVQGLWDSCELGAVVADRETGQYFDRSKVHALNHDGKHFSVRGPLGVSRSPQGQPVIVQAGASDAGRAFAAKFAEVVFTVQQDAAEARMFYAGMKEKVASFGRSPDHCNILPGLFTVVGRSEEEARAKYGLLRSYIRPGSALGVMSQRFGHDMTRYGMDEPFPELEATETGGHSFMRVFVAKARREGLTLRDIHDIFALSRGYPLIVGTPDTVADFMQEWFLGQACDGFMLLPAHFPGDLDEFGTLVVPELQRRGLFRTDYEGTTLRSHFGLAEPKNRFAAVR